MPIFETFLHFFTPRHSNNHRARALQTPFLTFYLVLLLVFQIGITGLGRFQPAVLSYATNISVSDLLNTTNEKRLASGAEPVQLNSKLSAAAEHKAEDMFANQYWAHTSPSGRDPWFFIVGADYHYLFAGENLARDFGDSRSVVNAWMNSQSHRDNLLNPRYKDIGFAVVNGKYAGHETTLVVQMFGTRSGGSPTVQTNEAAPAAVLPPSTSSAGQILNLKSLPVSPPKLNPSSLTKNISLGILTALIIIFAIDGILVYHRRIARLTGHNLAHLLILLAALAALNLINHGFIL